MTTSSTIKVNGNVVYVKTHKAARVERLILINTEKSISDGALVTKKNCKRGTRLTEKRFVGINENVITPDENKLFNRLSPNALPSLLVANFMYRIFDLVTLPGSLHAHQVQHRIRYIHLLAC